MTAQGPRDRLALGVIVVDLARGVVDPGGQRVRLTESERRVLTALAAAPREVLSRARLAACVRPRRPVREGTVTTTVHRLRAKLGAAGATLVTVVGEGYRLDSPTPSAPRPSTVLVGRERELLALGTGAPVCWVVGPGGVGKTALIRAFVSCDAAWMRSVHWVDLADLATREALFPAIARTLGVPTASAEPVDVLAARVAAEIASRETSAFVFDTADRVAAILDAWLRSFTPGRESRIIIASRTPPRSSSGLLAIGPLARADARTLFALRVEQVRLGRAVRPDELDVAHAIADALGGLPLAIELAACRATAGPLDRIRAELTEPLDVLAADAGPWEPHQWSLRRVLDDSFALRSQREQEVLLTLALFGRTFAATEVADLFPEAAEDVAATLATLIVAGWVGRAPNAERLRMVDVVRSYCAERRRAHPRRAALHEAFCAHIAARAAAWLDPRLDVGAADLSQDLIDEREQITAAWGLATADRHKALLSAALGLIAVRLGPREAISDALARLPPACEPASLRALVEHRRAILADVLGRHDCANAAYIRGIAAAETGWGEPARVDGVWGREHDDAGRLLFRLLAAEAGAGHLAPDEALRRLQRARSVARELRDRELMRFAELRVAGHLSRNERYAEALELLDAAKVGARGSVSLLSRMHLASLRAQALAELGAVEAAVTACDEALALMDEAEHRLDRGHIHHIRAIAWAEDDPAAALRELEVARARHLEFGRDPEAAAVVLTAAIIRGAIGAPVDAAALDALRPTLDVRHRAWAEALVAFLRGSPAGLADAERRLGERPLPATRAAIGALRGERRDQDGFRARWSARLVARLASR